MHSNKFMVMGSWFMENIDELTTKAKRTNNQVGQSLVEVVVVIAVIAIVVGGLVFATIASIRNATFAKNHAQATKYAQEAVERVRTARDRRDVSTISGFTLASQPVTDWQDPDLWANQISTSCNPCYFRITSVLGVLQYQGTTPSSPEAIGSLRRSIILSDTSNFGVEKVVTAIVSWNDFLGKTHESKIVTILRKL